MKSICIFLDFDETITYLPSYESIYPHGIVDTYEKNFRDFINTKFKDNLKEFKFVGIYIITRNQRKVVLDFCKYFNIHFDMIVGSHNLVSTEKGIDLYGKRLFNLDYDGDVRNIILKSGNNINEYWSYLKHYSMRNIMKKHKIDYGIFFDDDSYNYGYIYDSINITKREKLTRKLIPYNDVTIDIDPKIILMDIAFFNKVNGKSGIFHSNDKLIKSLKSVKLKINIREKYYDLIKNNITQKNIYSLIELIIQHRIKYLSNPYSPKSKFDFIEKIIEYAKLKKIYSNIKNIY
jgi:hypothetical protein